MAEEIIICPKDTEKQYFRSVCEDVFRKGNIRHWCKDCEAFRSTEKSDNTR